MSVILLGVKTVLAVIVVIAAFAAEARPFQRTGSASVARDTFVDGGHDLHLGNEPRPVGLFGEIDCDIVTIRGDCYKKSWKSKSGSDSGKRWSYM